MWGNPMSLIDQGKEVPCPGPCVYTGSFKLFSAYALSTEEKLNPLQCISPAPGCLEHWDFQLGNANTLRPLIHVSSETDSCLATHTCAQLVANG